MLFRNSKSLALYSLLAFSEGVLGRPLSEDAVVSRREDDLSLGVTGDLLPRHTLGKRVDVVVPEGDAAAAGAAAAGAGPKGNAGAGGSGGSSNSAAGKAPAIGSDQAGNQAGGGGGTSGGGGNRPAAIGSDQAGSNHGASDTACARSVGKRCGDAPASAGKPSDQQQKAWDSAKSKSAAAIKAQNDGVGNKNTPDKQLKDWTKAYQDREGKTKPLQDIFKTEGGGSSKYTSDLKLNTGSPYIHHKFWANEPAADWLTKAQTRTVHEAYYGKEDGAIIAKTSYAEADGTKGDNQMKWYEFAAKAWSETAGGPEGKVAELKWIARDDVRGPDSQSVIDAALIKSGKGDGPAKFTPNEPDFQALAGTDNGRSPFYLTGRFHTMLGDREVKSIRAWKDPDGKYYMALEIGPK